MQHCNHLQVTILGRHDQDELLLLASDGLWDVLSNQVPHQTSQQWRNPSFV
jgi:serine/threonine protein phosphatase PrpC